MTDEYLGGGVMLSDDRGNEEEWLAFRRTGIGGSDAPVLMGLDPTNGPLSLYVDKMGLELDVDNTPHEAAYWGRTLEAIVAEEFALRSGLRIAKPDRVFRHREHPWMLGTVDRLVYDPKHPRYEGVFEVPGGILEVKTTSVRREHLWEDGVPPVPYAQLQHYLAVTGLGNGFVAVLIGGQQFRWYEVPRNEAYIVELIEREEKFWQYIERQEPPPIDGTDAATAIVNRRYSEAIAEASVDVDDEVATLVQRLHEVKIGGKSFEKEQAEIENRIKVALGHAEYGVHRGQVIVTWKQSESHRVDTSRLKRELPEVATEYTKVTRSRTLRLPGRVASGEVPEHIENVEHDVAHELVEG
jgi:putative phage-type endonuclease